jgi:hypothetical protein
MRKQLDIRVLILVEDMWIFTFYKHTQSIFAGRGKSVGTANSYGLDGIGIEPGLGEIFRPVQTGPGAHPASYIIGTMSLSL